MLNMSKEKSMVIFGFPKTKKEKDSQQAQL